ncbi:FAD/NAD(P)-binding domain-containing protein [Penicillium hetheringtonii]|uniref:FAD/NAD(P)-binding domain-containing protein n=1 Tax=Penicillium hetheringtonii TaxID=911720 RepID=A0AAD6DCJ3_9EURO|nr:FAD/NAD(P)-binding domain-containing protein [Penicillium hetheringtonii]
MGQGGAMAIEDAVSIATLLPLGTKMQDVRARLAMYNHSRRPRVDMVLHYTRLNGRREDDEKNIRITPAERIDFMKICISHNELKTSQELLDRCNIHSS